MINIDQIKDLLTRIVDHCRLEVAIVKELEEIQNRLYALEENRKVKDKSIEMLQKDVSSIKLMLRKKV